MPELPEVETIARDLDAAVRHARILAAHAHRADVLRQCTARSLRARMTGATIAQVWRRGKYVLVDLDNHDHLVVSPRFTGAFFIDPAPFRRSRGDYTVLQLPLEDGRTLRYRDVRRLGTVSLMDDDAFAAWERTLGPEPFDPSLTDARFADAMRASSRAIKTLLMDQRRIAGIGNIYANEALWRARIRPTRRGHTITRAALARLLAEARDVLRVAVEQRGTSFRDYQDPYGGRGGFLGLAKVYARAGKPCVRCGTTLKSSHALEGRITVWCTKCQK